MKAYNGSVKLKEELIAKIRQHRKAEQLVKGLYWKGNGDGKGCAVGCLTHNPEGGHAQYESEWEIPEVLAHLEDAIFEGLPETDAQEWPERFLAAIKPGADLSIVWPRFAVWMLMDRRDGVIRFAINDKVKSALTNVAALWERVIAGESVKSLRAEFEAAEAAAEAARAAARDAAWAVAEAAAEAARAAAWAAAEAARAAAWAVAWVRMADKLIALLEEAK